MLREFKESVSLTLRAERLRRRCNRHADWRGVVDEVIGDSHFRAVQNRAEILRLLELVRQLNPRHVLEIGTGSGGTLCLLARAAAADARLLSIDVGTTAVQCRANARLASDGQQVSCLTADSHSQATRAKVIEWLGGRRLDFLFIDGDHSLDGVSKDFSMYSPLVRPGGLVAFHDIVPDFRTRFGIATPADVGQVPLFWDGLKQRFQERLEFIEALDQDGRGIGVLTWPGSQM